MLHLPSPTAFDNKVSNPLSLKPTNAGWDINAQGDLQQLQYDYYYQYNDFISAFYSCFKAYS
jgi:hypothetical protein